MPTPMFREIVHYPAGCPTALAEPVPTWSDMAEAGARPRSASIGDIRVLGFETTLPPTPGCPWIVEWYRTGQYDDLPPQRLAVDTELAARWWFAVAVAVAAGMPGHPADHGFEADQTGGRPRWRGWSEGWPGDLIRDYRGWRFRGRKRGVGGVVDTKPTDEWIARTVAFETMGVDVERANRTSG